MEWSSRMRGVGLRAIAWRATTSLSTVALASLLSIAFITDAHAQDGRQQSPAQKQSLPAKINDESLLLLAGSSAASYLSIAQDIALIAGGNPRVISMTASGGLDNLSDLLFLRGVDMAIVPSNVLAHAESVTSLGPNLRQRITYVSRLYNEEVHLLVGREISSLTDLNGKRLGIATGDGNAAFTATDLFKRLGVTIEVLPLTPATAMEQLRSGEIAALMLIGGKPMYFVARLPKDGSVRLLELPSPKSVDDAYAPAVFRASDYPNLIPTGASVEALSLTAVLMTTTGRGSEASQRRVTPFVSAFFEGLTTRRTVDLHPKWMEVNLAASVPGWTRARPAQEWLEQAKQRQVSTLQLSFEEFLRAHNSALGGEPSPEVRQKLFDEFVKWTRKSVAAPSPPAR
jgi:TRAP-type uncharacterized transport system substrate-binding protein